jgi:hypothetical protein
MSKRNNKSTERDGCGYLLIACLAISVLLALNGVIVAVVFNWVTSQGGHWVQHSKVAQAFVFMAPVLLMFAEWWLVDLFFGRRLLGRRPSKSSQPLGK